MHCLLHTKGTHMSTEHYPQAEKHYLEFFRDNIVQQSWHCEDHMLDPPNYNIMTHQDNFKEGPQCAVADFSTLIAQTLTVCGLTLAPFLFLRCLFLIDVWNSCRTLCVICVCVEVWISIAGLLKKSAKHGHTNFMLTFILVQIRNKWHATCNPPQYCVSLSFLYCVLVPHHSAAYCFSRELTVPCWDIGRGRSMCFWTCSPSLSM